MKNQIVPFVFLTLLCMCPVPAVIAHVPRTGGDNESPQTATLVSDPTTSQVVYTELHEGGEAQYYRFDIGQGERIHVSLLVSPRIEDGEFVPSFVLAGQGIEAQGSIPPYVEIPEGLSSMVKEGHRPAQATYEAFAPSSYYQVADLVIDAPTSSTYYVAVYEPNRGGNYALVVGDREAFTIDEWLLTPFSLLSVYQWEGQNIIMVFVPMVATVLIGFGLLVWRRGMREVPKTLVNWVGTSAGILFIGTTASILTQTGLSLTHTSIVPEVAVTLILALMPLVLGITTMSLAWRKGRKVDARMRVYLAILGVLALFSWAGLLVGPALALLAAIMPSAEVSL